MLAASVTLQMAQATQAEGLGFPEPSSCAGWGAVGAKLLVSRQGNGAQDGDEIMQNVSGRGREWTPGPQPRPGFSPVREEAGLDTAPRSGSLQPS